MGMAFLLTGSGSRGELASNRVRPSGCHRGSGEVGAMLAIRQRHAVTMASAPAGCTHPMLIICTGHLPNLALCLGAVQGCV